MTSPDRAHGPPSRLSRDLMAGAALAAAYAIVGRLSLELFDFLNPTASPVWPPTGIAIAGLLLGGLRLFPAVWVAAFLVNVANPDGPGAVASLAIAAGNTLEAVVAAFLVRQFAGGTQAFSSVRGVFLFALIVVDAALVSAAFGTLALLGSGLPTTSAPAVLATWWIGDAVGGLLVTPVLVMWARDRSLGRIAARKGEAAALVASVALLGMLLYVLGEYASMRYGSQFRFLALPIVVWAAFRFGVREAATTTLAVAAVAIAVIVTLSSANPEVAWMLLLLQAFLGVAALTGMAVGAVVDERRRALESLRQTRDELELRVAVRTAALETALDDLARSNKDLQEFAYVASHDLQEPLRAVAGYTQLLQRRHGPALPPEAQALIANAVDGASRMQALINDLLSFSRVGTHGQPLRPLPLQEPLEVALRNLETSIRETSARVTHDPMPRVVADDGQMVQLFQNLIGNALKFRAGDRPPEVHIGVEPGVNGMATFFVKDNGIGIDPRHHQRVFVIFQRLHRPGEYPGSGIGLSVAKRIVERHGGRIWVESQPGHGSTFRFTLRTAP